MKHNVGDDVVRKHIRKIVDAVADPNPVVVHLNSGDTRATLDRIVPHRPIEWWDSFVSYHTEQAYGQAHRLHGIDGTVRALQDRRRLEDDLLATLPLQFVRIDTSKGWDAAHTAVAELIA